MSISHWHPSIEGYYTLSTWSSSTTCMTWWWEHPCRQICSGKPTEIGYILWQWILRFVVTQRSIVMIYPKLGMCVMGVVVSGISVRVWVLFRLKENKKTGREYKLPNFHKMEIGVIFKSVLSNAVVPIFAIDLACHSLVSAIFLGKYSWLLCPPERKWEVLSVLYARGHRLPSRWADVENDFFL